MEYGYFARDGRYIPGYHFMRRGAQEAEGAAADTTVQVLADELEKEWGKP